MNTSICHNIQPLRLIAYIFGFYILCLCSNVLAQNTSVVSGTAVDSEIKPIDFGLVLMYRLKDSSLVKTTTIKEGKFVFEVVLPGDYFLQTNCMGYLPSVINMSVPLAKQIQFILRDDPKSLKEIEIKGYRDAFEFKHGNILSNIENSVLATLPDMMEVLSKLPTVQMSNDREQINIIGRGTPVIYIENQRVSLDDIRVLSVADIKSIEIVNNPSAKYEAEGSVVLLIKRKTNLANGYKAEVSELASMKRFFENRLATNIGFKRNKLEFRLNVQYNYINRWEGIGGNISTDTGNYTSSFNGTSVGPRKQYQLGTGLYYQINSVDYFSVQVNTRMQEEPFTSRTASSEKINGIEQIMDNKALGYSRRPFINSIWNFQKQLPSGAGLLFLGAQLGHYERNLGNAISNNSGQGFFATENRSQFSNFNLGIWRADYEKILTASTKLGLGMLLTSAGAGTEFERDLVVQGISSKTKYQYRENNQAYYTQIEGEKKKINYQLGFRVETTNLKGAYENNPVPLINRNFINFFPKATLTFSLDSFSNIRVNYSRNIRRPDYANANQVTNYITPFLEFSNNININPSLMDELRIVYSYQKISVALSFNYQSNPAFFVTRYDSLIGKIRIINENLSTARGGALTITMPYQYKSYSSTNIVSVFYNQVTDNRAIPLSTIPYYYFYSNNQWRFSKQYTFVLSGWINTARKEAVFEHNLQFAVDLSLTKQFAKNWVLGVNAFDIFRSLNYTESYRINQLQSNLTYYENVREFSLSVKYTFGALQKAQYKNKEINEGSRIN